MKDYVQRAMETKADQRKILDRLHFACGTDGMQLINGVVGLMDEVGELASCSKKWIEYGQALDITNIKEEVGDAFWRLAQICQAVGLTFEECMEANLAKLQGKKGRYEKGYSDAAAKEENRDRAAERQILETPLEEFMSTSGLPAIGDPYTQTGSGWAEPAEEKEVKQPLKDPWLEPNAHGEPQGGICCKRAIGKYCYEHDPVNYDMSVNGFWMLRSDIQSDIPTLKPKPLGHSYTRYCTHCKTKPIHKTNELGICTDCFMKHGEPKEVASNDR